MKPLKTIVLSLTAVALTGALVPAASAGDREWATAGKVLTGLAAVSLFSRVLEAPPAYAYPPAAVAPRVVCAPPGYAPPAPVVVYAPPVYVQSEPVVVYQNPGYYYSPPIYVRTESCYRGRPVVVETRHHHEYRHGPAPAHFSR